MDAHCVQLFCFNVGIPTARSAYAATLLEDAVHDWWTAYLQRWGGRMPPDWVTFQLALLDRFGSKLRAK